MGHEAAYLGPPPDDVEGSRPDSGGPSGPGQAGGATWDWDDLYSRMAGGLVALGVRRYGISHEDAEEALQRAVLAILAAAPVVRNAEAYLTAAYLREAADAIRRRRVLASREVALQEGLEKPNDDSERIFVVCHFRKAFSALSPFCRRVMRSCLLDGLERKEAAVEASASSKTIFKRYRKCLRTLANALA